MQHAPVIVFRADASLDIATGHIMRCLTLADALVADGARCHFICRALSGNLAARIRRHGHDCFLLPAPEAVEDDGATPHSAWLGVSRARDAQDCNRLLPELRPDWLVVDHYALDSAWEQAVRPNVNKIMVIDDLADRPHDCDLLVDPSLGRAARDYDGKRPPHSKALVGPRYALLRPEFPAHRAESLARRRSIDPKHILVSVGGIDKDNATKAVLDALAAIPLPRACRITVVLSAAAPWLADIRARVARMPVPTELKVDAPDMARLMTQADLAIGAAGTSSWERCCLGLPTLLLVLAENQKPIAEALAAAGAAIQLPRDRGALPTALRESLGAHDLPVRLERISTAAAELVDGDGIARCVDEMTSAAPYRVRPATLDDARAIYDWRYRATSALYYQTPDIPSLSQHTAWMTSALEDQNRTLLIVENGHGAIAHVRLDRASNAPHRQVVSICICPSLRGQGQSAAILGATLAHHAARAGDAYVADIHQDHTASLRLFRALGFRDETRHGTFLRLTAPATHFRPAASECAAGTNQTDSRDLDVQD